MSLFTLISFPYWSPSISALGKKKKSKHASIFMNKWKMNNSIHHLHVDPNQRFLIGDSCKGFLKKNLSHPNPLTQNLWKMGLGGREAPSLGLKPRLRKQCQSWRLPQIYNVGIVSGFILRQWTFIIKIHLTYCLERWASWSY